MNGYIKKKLIIAALILMNVFIATSCAKTPDKKVVVDKSEGLSKESIIPEEKDTPKDLKVPEHWKETMERSDGYVTVEADCQMEISEIYNTPVYSYEMAPMTEERLKALCDYFADGDKLYEEPAMTKSELQVQKDKMDSRRGDWGRCDAGAISAMAERVDELIGKAPQERTCNYIEAALTAPRQSEKEYVREQSPFPVDKNSAYYYDTEEEIGLKARVDRGAEVNPVIHGMDFNDKLGSTSNFLFSQGTYIDEKWMESTLKNQEIFGFGEEYGNYLNRLQEDWEQTIDESFSREDALKEAEKVLEALSLEDYAVTECYKAIGSAEYESWSGLDEENLPLEMGYSIYMLPKAGDVIGYEQPFQEPQTDLPEMIYAPPFSTEKIHMIITKEGIRLFEWTNISQRKDEIAANTKLLSFEEMKEKMADHLLYAALSGYRQDDKKDGYSYRYKVKDAQLRAANIPAYEDPTAAWLVPVWVFQLEYEFLTPKKEATRFSDKIVVLNAIDGGYIQPRIDSRISIPSNG